MKQAAVEESCASESSEDNVPKKKGNKFTVNTSYCRSELELLQHVIYKNNLKET